MKISFTQFWPGFKPDENFFFRLLESQELDPGLLKRSERTSDLEIVSVFPARKDLIKKKVMSVLRKSASGGSEQALANTTDNLPLRIGNKRIWFTGENIRVPIGQDFDFSLSYEQDNYHSSNLYFPLWYTALDWFGSPEFSHRVGKNLTAKELLEPRILERTPTKFACAFIGNPHPMRSRAINDLSRLGVVDVFGKAVGRPVKHKAEIAADYKYMICFENDLYPGYVTEKALDAYHSGTVPLYWGDFGNDGAINHDSVLNLANFENLDSFVDYVASLSNRQYRDIYEQPFLHFKPDLTPLINFIKNA